MANRNDMFDWETTTRSNAFISHRTRSYTWIWRSVLQYLLIKHTLKRGKITNQVLNKESLFCPNYEQNIQMPNPHHLYAYSMTIKCWFVSFILFNVLSVPKHFYRSTASFKERENSILCQLAYSSFYYYDQINTQKLQGVIEWLTESFFKWRILLSDL